MPSSGSGVCGKLYYVGSMQLRIFQIVVSVALPALILAYVKLERWYNREKSKRVHNSRAKFLMRLIQPLSCVCTSGDGVVLPVYDFVLWLSLATVSIRAMLTVGQLLAENSFSWDESQWWFWILWGFGLQGSRQFLGCVITFLLVQRSSGRLAFKRAIQAAFVMYFLTGTMSGLAVWATHGDKRTSTACFLAIDLFTVCVFASVFVYMVGYPRRRWRALYIYVGFQLVSNILYFLGSVSMLVPQGKPGHDEPCFWTAGDVCFVWIMPFLIFLTLRDDSKYWRDLSLLVGSSSKSAGAELFEGTIASVSMRQMDDLSDFLAMEVKMLDFTKLEILEPLGSGASASVFRALYGENEIAVKSMDFQELTLEVIRNFCKEAILSFKLKHRNIVRFYGVCLQPPNMFLAYEFCKQGSLRAFLDSNVRLPTNVRVQLAMDAAAGMEFLHSKRIIHRDLKSSNVLVQQDESGTYTAKIADFGLSRMLAAIPAPPAAKGSGVSSTLDSNSATRHFTPGESMGSSTAAGLFPSSVQKSEIRAPGDMKKDDDFLASASAELVSRARKDAKMQQRKQVGDGGSQPMFGWHGFFGGNEDDIPKLTTGVGTIEYLPPEILKEISMTNDGAFSEVQPTPDTHYDYSADVFAFGVVMWEIMTRKMPYDDIQTPEAVQKYVLSGARLDVSSRRFPESYTDLMSKCWRAQPSRRPPFSVISSSLQQIWFHDCEAYNSDEEMDPDQFVGRSQLTDASEMDHLTIQMKESPATDKKTSFSVRKLLRTSIGVSSQDFTEPLLSDAKGTDGSVTINIVPPASNASKSSGNLSARSRTVSALVKVSGDFDSEDVKS